MGERFKGPNATIKKGASSNDDEVRSDVAVATMVPILTAREMGSVVSQAHNEGKRWGVLRIQ